MLQLGDSFRSTTRVNVLKKVKVNGRWKLCPAIVEPGGRLKDRVQVNGHAEIHAEGIYYIDWREKSRRRRKAVSNRNEVLEHARLKALELDAGRAGIVINRVQPATLLPAVIRSNGPGASPIEINQRSKAASVLLRGVESYLQELISATVTAQLAKLGVATGTLVPGLPLALTPRHSAKTKMR